MGLNREDPPRSRPLPNIWLDSLLFLPVPTVANITQSAPSFMTVIVTGINQHHANVSLPCYGENVVAEFCSTMGGKFMCSPGLWGLCVAQDCGDYV
jgi:hypothetical protein